MTSFWIITGMMAVLAAAILARAAWRDAARPLEARAQSDIEVYRAQLAELERDVARGVVQPADAENARTEIARRILAADAAQDPRADAQGPGKRVILVLGVLLVAGSLALYLRIGAPGYGDLALVDRIAFAEEVRKTRPDQATAEASLPAHQMPDGLSPDYIDLLEKLRLTVANRPDDLQGNALLVQNEVNVGNFSAAARAQRNVLRIKGDQATVEDLANYGEFLVLAAGGYVSPQAEVALRAALARDGRNGTARYYLGLMLVQTGRPDQGFRIWDALLREGPEDAPWIPPILAQITEVSQLAGVRYDIPEIGTARGPTAEDVQNAADMSPAERMEMIGAMVEGLSDRLAREGGPAEDWARLISSLGVLGETDRAAAIYGNAVEVFGDDPGAMDQLRAAGQRAGVVE